VRGVIVAVLATLVLAPGVARSRPNVVVILADDLGYSDIGAFGGEIRTPQLDALAEQGVRFTQFSVTPRCSPTRAALLTGLDSHEAGFGHLPSLGARPAAYRGVIPDDVPTLPERLQAAGYSTYMSGKWHLTTKTRVKPGEMVEPHPSWPRAHGFDRFYGTLMGSGSFFWPPSLMRDDVFVEPEGEEFYYTDAISAEAARFLREHAAQRPDTPFFLYLAYTAPHWPMHAPQDELERQAGRYEEGWDVLRVHRFERMRTLGIVPEDTVLTERDPAVPAWDDAPHRAWQVRRMQVYAAMTERMDRGIGGVLDVLSETDVLDDTIVLFFSDNGGCSEELPASNRLLRRLLGAESAARTSDGGSVPYGSDPDILPGGEDSFQSYGRGWSNASNTPFRLHKSWAHQGGVASPLIVRWPGGVRVPGGTLIHEPAHVVDVTATILDAAGVPAPELRGESLSPLLQGHTRARAPIFWEHEGNRGVRDGHRKLVAVRGGPWELYDLATDRTETRDLASAQPERVRALSELWDAWAAEVGVRPWPWVVPLAQYLLAGIVLIALAAIGLGWLLVRRWVRS
jgi:arylsulfatase A-like enzyme